MCYSARIPASGSLLFACPKRSNQEKRHPHGRGRRASCPAPYARPLRRFADGTSVCRQRTPAHRARAPLGFFLRGLAAAERDPVGAERGRPGRRSKSGTDAYVRRLGESQDPAPSLGSCPRVPLCRPQRTGAERRRDTEGVFSLVTFSCTSTAPQERRERRSRPEGRRAGCPESQKVTRPPGRRTETPMDVSRSSRSAQDRKRAEAKTPDPRFRRDNEIEG